MKNFLKGLMLIAVAAVSVVACNDADVDDPTLELTSGTTLIAVTPASSETKVEFTDNDTAGIALEWESGDSFTIYDESGARVGDFTCTNVEAKEFTNSAITLTDGATYTALFPASTLVTLAEAKAADLTSSQNGDAISKLNASCAMEASFTYTEGDAVSMTFEHLKAVMTFVFTSDERPAKLVYGNGSAKYEVTYTDIEAEDGYYTSHIMIEPCGATTRTLTFILYDEYDVAYDIRTVSGSKAYEAGYRYTSSVSGLTNLYADGVYYVDDAFDLKAFADLVNGGAYSIDCKLMTNIDLEGVCSEDLGSWTPIGSATNKYTGTFDGDGYEVQNLYIDSAYSQRGLFGFTALDGVVCNLGVTGSVTSSNDGTSYETAGVVAFNYGTVVNCYNLAEVTGEINVGGVVGHNDGCVVNCYNRGKITGTGADTEGKNIGGVCGQCDDESDVTDLVGYGYILACYNTGEVSGITNIGGVLGWFNVSDRSYLSCCYCLKSSDNLIGWMKVGSNGETAGALVASAYMLSEDDMQGSAVVTALNAKAVECNLDSNLKVKACAWKQVSGGYPELDFGVTPSN
ncbi:MAG: hypothetical protein SNH73_00995 [Rikenellaceae bacterium]